MYDKLYVTDNPAQRLYSKIASRYEGVFEPALLAENILYTKIRNYIGNGRLLDAGCGSGRWLGFLPENSYTGIDINFVMLQAAKEQHPKANFICADIRNIPCQDACFDFIISMFGVISHLTLEEQLIAVQEMKRVLKLGGLVMITTGNVLSLFSLPVTLRGGRIKIEGERFRIHNVTPTQLKSLLSGFEILELGSYDFSFVPIQAVKLLATAANRDYRACYSYLMDVYQETTDLPIVQWFGKQLYVIAKKNREG